MRLADAGKIFMGILMATGLVGIVLIGVAFGHLLRIGGVLSIGGYPLFGAGVQCLTASGVGALLLLAARRGAHRQD